MGLVDHSHLIPDYHLSREFNALTRPPIPPIPATPPHIIVSASPLWSWPPSCPTCAMLLPPFIDFSVRKSWPSFLTPQNYVFVSGLPVLWQTLYNFAMIWMFLETQSQCFLCTCSPSLLSTGFSLLHKYTQWVYLLDYECAGPSHPIQHFSQLPSSSCECHGQ